MVKEREVKGSKLKARELEKTSSLSQGVEDFKVLSGSATYQPGADVQRAWTAVLVSCGKSKRMRANLMQSWEGAEIPGSGVLRIPSLTGLC